MRGMLSSLPLKAVSTPSTPFIFPSSPSSLVDFQNITVQLCAGCEPFALQAGPKLCSKTHTSDAKLQEQET